MTVKQFKRRWLNSKVEPELFYMPVKKEEEKVGRLLLKTVENKYVNFDVYDNDFFREKYPDIFNSPYRAAYFKEAILYDSSMTFIAKIGGSSFITISNIPYGKYYLKIIKTFGFQLPKQPIEIIINSDTTIITIELFPTFIKHQLQVEDTLVDYKIYSYPEKYSYERYGYVWYSQDIILSVNQPPQGTIVSLFYDYKNNYLGKVYCGYNELIYIDGVVISGSQRGYVFCKTPALNTQIYGIVAGSEHKQNYFATVTLSFTGERSYATIECVPNSIRNLIKTNKISNFYYNKSFIYEKYNDISATPRQPEDYHNTFNLDSGFTSEFNVLYGDWNIYDPDTKEKIGEKAYLEDGMTRSIYANFLFNKVRKNFLYYTDEYGLSIGSTYFPYENVLENEDMVIYYCNYTIYSDDYNDYIGYPLNNLSYIDYNNLI